MANSRCKNDANFNEKKQSTTDKSDRFVFGFTNLNSKNFVNTKKLHYKTMDLLNMSGRKISHFYAIFRNVSYF